MREILFRGKRLDNGEWVEGCYVYTNSGRSFIKINKPVTPHFSNDVFEVIPETIGQFTGLTDRNGRKIFEGDILQCNNNPEDIVKAVFGKFSVIDVCNEWAVDEVIGWHYVPIPTNNILTQIEPYCFPMPLTDYYINRCDMKIVGNIHDNPEILKKWNKAERMQHGNCRDCCEVDCGACLLGDDPARICSECGERNAISYDYCPHCGAKMTTPNFPELLKGEDTEC